MYAIVEINGQQFKAEAGKKLFVHHIQNAENGATVEFDKVLLVDKDGNITVGAPTVEGAKVVCQVVSNMVKGDKVLVFHKKRRKGYRKLNGHRQQFTELTITESTENTESKEENKQKQIVLAIDNNKMVTTSFDEPIKDGIIDLSMGKSSKDSDEISKQLKSTSTIATILNSGEMPLSYKVMQNQFVKENTSDKANDAEER